jgi:hypothetical protein
MKTLLFVLVVFGLSDALDTLKTPNTFSNRDTISSVKFNQNFDTIRTRVNRIIDTVNGRTRANSTLKVDSLNVRAFTMTGKKLLIDTLKTDSVYARTVKLGGGAIIGTNSNIIDSVKKTTGGGVDTLKIWSGSSLFKVTN